MFDTIQPGNTPGTTTPVTHPDPAPDPAPDPDPPEPAPPGPPCPLGPVPLERLEAQICELAGHLTAATCRFLVLLGDFDARDGWASWDMPSCAAWLSWKCQMASGTAREHVRVARALRDLPVIRADFAAGKLSYAKVRALTRIATPATDQGLAEIAAPMTGDQLERFARAHRRVTRTDDTTTRIKRRLAWRIEDDGTLAGTFRLPPLAGAVLLQALRAAASDLEHPHPRHDGNTTAQTPPAPAADTLAAPAAPAAETTPRAAGETPAEEPGAPSGQAPAAAGGTSGASGAEPVTATSSNLADALLVIAEAFLASKAAAADNPDVYQVIIHVGTDTLTTRNPAAHDPAAADLSSGSPVTNSDEPATGSSAETPPTRRVPGHPADPARCHVDDGPAISVNTADMILCTATLSWMLHDHDGTLLDVGRRRRKPTAALRRAARERDHGRCRHPGCESRRVDLHHIRHWINGGKTCLDNIISLCKAHHMLIHQRDYLIAPAPGGTFTFYRPDGTLLPTSPAPPPITGTIQDCHDADITPATIIPGWYGERLDLDHAIHACFAHAEYTARHPDQPQQQDEQPTAPAPEPEPETEPWHPTATEVDIIAAIQRACQKYAIA
jgi:hypothetical protein